MLRLVNNGTISCSISSFKIVFKYIFIYFFFFLQFVGGSYTTINLVYGFFQNFIIARLWVLRKLKMSQP